jgi:transcriptional regulator with XRE-family HTH domain
MKQDEQGKQSMIGKKLNQYRIEHDLTFEAMAEIVNENLPEDSRVHASTLSRIANGVAEPNERTLYKIKKAFPVLFKDAA